MDIKHPIQIIHDIETGYGDPLGIKAIPDFSLRFVDEEYKDANDTIAKIQDLMVKWFESRDTDLARKGLKALSSSFAAIYYIPFQCGMSLHFRFSGQSIPNRSEVKEEKGVKIYFDPISTANREKQTALLVKKIFSGDQILMLNERLDPVETIVYHVAAHEVGHAIYSSFSFLCRSLFPLASIHCFLFLFLFLFLLFFYYSSLVAPNLDIEQVKGSIKTTTRTLLEEPRAELTTLHTMKLMSQKGILTPSDLQKV